MPRAAMPTSKPPAIPESARLNDASVTGTSSGETRSSRPFPRSAAGSTPNARAAAVFAAVTMLSPSNVSIASGLLSKSERKRSSLSSMRSSVSTCSVTSWIEMNAPVISRPLRIGPPVTLPLKTVPSGRRTGNEMLIVEPCVTTSVKSEWTSSRLSGPTYSSKRWPIISAIGTRIMRSLPALASVIRPSRSTNETESGVAENNDFRRPSLSVAASRAATICVTSSARLMKPRCGPRSMKALNHRHQITVPSLRTLRFSEVFHFRPASNSRTNPSTCMVSSP
jgi:hypothetical protein